jgi:hypothetical protein
MFKVNDRSQVAMTLEQQRARAAEILRKLREQVGNSQ